MERELFSSAISVSRDRTRAGTVPVSAALHAGVIVAGVLLADAFRSESAPPPRPQGPWIVRVDPQSGPAAQPPKGDGRPVVRKPASVPKRAAAAPAAPAPTPLAAPAAIADTLPPEPDVAPPETAAAANVPLGSGSSGTGLCTTCDGASGADPNATATTGDGDGGSGSGPVRVAELSAPRRIRYVAPTYPPIARTGRIQGAVEIDCTIDVDGTVRDVRYLKGNPVFFPAARAAVLQWVYTPTRLSGRPVAVLLTVTVTFRLTH